MVVSSFYDVIQLYIEFFCRIFNRIANYRYSENTSLYSFKISSILRLYSNKTINFCIQTKKSFFYEFLLASQLFINLKRSQNFISGSLFTNLYDLIRILKQFQRMAKQKNNNNLKRILNLVEVASSKIGTENFALSLMVTANLLWPLAFLYVSLHHFSPLQTNLVRGTSICASHILICMFLGIDLDFKSWRDIKYLLVRNTLIGVHQLVYTAMHFVLSFPLINSIVITGPLFVFIIDYYINGVTINRMQIIGIVISFFGILININGELLMNFIDPAYQTTTTYQNYEVSDIKTKIIFSLLAVLTNVIWGFAIVAQKQVKHMPGIKISFFLGIEFIFTSGASYNFGIVDPVSLTEFLTACLFSGLVMALCQIMFISALNLSKNTGKLTILMLLYSVTGYAISFFKFGENLNFICLSGLLLMSYGLYRTIFSADN